MQDIPLLHDILQAFLHTQLNERPVFAQLLHFEYLGGSMKTCNCDFHIWNNIWIWIKIIEAPYKIILSAHFTFGAVVTAALDLPQMLIMPGPLTWTIGLLSTLNWIQLWHVLTMVNYAIWVFVILPI